ncbi:ABC-three component system protein [Azotosporobacter soli]|uniref:ABC-three component system protein n=1 Tax=Azotosporobacter soli TaxID=3055040 RepID=UPI0031FEB55E
MQDNRRDFTENEKMLLHTEVKGRCPLCGDILTHAKNNKINKTFEVAHIYPANPRHDEVVLLANEERLSADVNDMKNVIAVCRKCHRIFDTPRTVEEYRKWFRLKKKLIQDAEVKSAYAVFNIEHEIRFVLERLNEQFLESEIVPLSYNSLKVDQKANNTLPYVIKQSIKRDVVDYFDYVRRIFIEIDKNTPYKFDTLAAQIKGFYSKCMQINQNQEYVYNALVDWINEKTDSYSRKSCEIIVAYFIQDCEVFS